MARQPNRVRPNNKFWADVRSKVAVARKQIERGRFVDGESEMQKVIAEIENEGRPKSPKSPSQ